MLGWSFSVDHQKDSTRPATAQEDEHDFIAFWQSHTYGLDWLDELVEQGNAICLSRVYYPSLYTLQLRHVLPVMAFRQPPHVRWLPRWENGKLIGRDRPQFTLIDKEIFTGDPDRWVLITVFDLS
ncbi:MAG: hypothetical protein FWE32_04040 [Oscillospiraceae bacterium]|nr:hypothetical protein [Oscillospiraceae bacterium]